MSNSRYINKQNLHGKVSLDHWNGKSLPYVDNLANLLVASQSEIDGITQEEIERVLAPNGVV
jgi:hypothetical protein